MAGLALLLTGCHEVERSGIEGLYGCLGLCHVALLIVLSGLLIPIAHVARVVDLIEGAQFKLFPLVGFHVVAAGVDGEAQVVAHLALDAAEHLGARADEQRGGDEALR